MRNLTKALTVVSLLAPVSGHSLGIGDIRVRSALNQNLNAEIALVASKGEKPSNIKVSLASADKFDEAGVPWTYFLSKIKFNTVVKPNGSMVIKVTSREALKEPYLNFLLEVTWPKGSLYREFTVLVDPPSEYEQSTYQEPVYQEPAYPLTSQYENYPPQQTYSPRPRPVRHSNRPKRTSNGSYGGQIVTRRNDTLWKVASRVRGAGVSVEQMMMSLFERNPNAFYQQNVNALAAGKTLKIPDKNTVQQISRQEALDEFTQHNTAWNNNRSGVPSSNRQLAKEEAVDSQLKLEAPVEATVDANENVAPSVEPSASAKNSASQSTSASQRQANTEKETAKGASPVDDALQSKVAALEKQMAMMQEIIALKDKQLAELQNPAQPPATPVSPPSPSSVTPEPTPAVPTEVKPEPTPPAPVVAPQPVPAPQAVKPAAPPVPATPVVKPTVKRIVQAPKPVVEESVSPLIWILGGLGGILLPLFGWLWWQKKKIIQETEAESMFRTYSSMRNTESNSPLSSISRRPASGTVSGESSFLNDFKASDFESFESFNVDHGDIDPIEEADVYLAYGRYQQAEDLIRQAINNNPEREECKLKLLEIFHASSNKEDFENYAMELAAAGKQEDKDFWRKVIELSKDICPDSPLFAIQIPSTVAVFTTESDVLAESVLLGSNAAAEQDAVNKLAENREYQGVASFQIDDDGANESAFETTESGVQQDIKKVEQPKFEVSESENDDVLSFDLDSFEDSLLKEQNNELLDFDLGPYPGASEKKAVDESTTLLLDEELMLDSESNTIKNDDSEVKNEIETFEFDFNLDKKETDKPDSKEREAAVETIDSWDPEQTLDFSIDVPVEKERSESNAIDFSFDLDPTLASSSKPGYQENGFNLSDLTDMDEIETKLDLAKAYIDMGDVESAKDIIGQVLEKGSLEQKKTAMALLDDLNLG
ncbi:MAG: FimV family protein [Methylococcaceae bacterium]|nr:FimV family protein [Methylococcaceae bacterium]